MLKCVAFTLFIYGDLYKSMFKVSLMSALNILKFTFEILILQHKLNGFVTCRAKCDDVRVFFGKKKWLSIVRCCWGWFENYVT